MTPQETRKKLCLQLKEISELKEINQGNIAKKTGITRNNISRSLSGVHSISFDTLIKIVCAIDCEIKFRDITRNE